MIENLLEAWQVIFDRHPDGEEIMQMIIDQDRVITSGQFVKWYGEATQRNEVSA